MINMTTPQEAQFYCEVIIGLDLEDGSTETDYSYAYFKEQPSEEDVQSLIPEGWRLLDKHILLTETELDEDDEPDYSQYVMEHSDQSAYPENWNSDSSEEDDWLDYDDSWYEDYELDD